MSSRIDIKKYIITFFITAVIFFGAFFVSNYFNDKRVEEIKAIQDKISVDILSSETQYDLLTSASCKNLDQSVLSKELNDLASRLSYMEDTVGDTNAEVLYLKQDYSLLEIKDYLLMQKIAEKCGHEPLSILYFYSNKGDCEECKQEGYVLTYLREQYPALRVYSFDYNLDVGALQTLISIDDVDNNLPALVINDKVYYGFKSVDDIQKILPQLSPLQKSATSTAATSTKK